jgi:hypothetical protein
MKYRYGAIVGFACLAGIIGCTYKLFIQVSEVSSPRPLFILSATSDGPSIAQPINQLVVVAESRGKWDHQSSIWCMGLPPGSFKEVAKVRYGVVPEGFSQCSVPRELQRGVRYQVVVTGAGSAAGSEFTLSP